MDSQELTKKIFKFIFRDSRYDQLNIHIYLDWEKATNKNTTYIDINVGAHFGIIDIVESMLLNKLDMNNWMSHKDVL